MNVKRFAARTSREALALVRQAFGTDAVVLSTKPCAEGVEVLAMAPESMAQVERLSDTAQRVSAEPQRAARAPAQSSALAPKGRPHAGIGQTGQALVNAHREVGGQAASARDEVEQDADSLSMSTLSFQDYVRQRMLKRRHAELHAAPVEEDTVPAQSARASLVQLATARAAADQRRTAAPAPRRMEAPVAPPSVFDEMRDDEGAMDAGFDTPAPRRAAPRAAMPAAHVPVLHDELPAAPAMRMPRAAASAPSQAAANHLDMVNELRSMKGLIEERFGALAFMEKLQRQPRQALLAQKMLDCGFSPALIRKLVDALPATAADEIEWAASVLERNLSTSEAEAAIEDQGGIYALVGSTGVGKTTSTAKIAAGFAARHGANQLGLITLDAYRVGAHEQLRAYGRILGVPVHTAHDRASLEDLLELLANKKMVLIDTAGMAQRDSRTRELLEMLQHRSIKRLLVIDAAAQGETIEDVIVNWRAAECKGVVLSKIDEAVKLAPALDALIRHKLKTVGVANGQRVPEDWHRLSANALVHRALKAGGSPAWRMDPQDVHLVFANAGLNTSAASALRI
jgi:flagellar biosynthesis protein FlhF